MSALKKQKARASAITTVPKTTRAGADTIVSCRRSHDQRGAPTLRRNQDPRQWTLSLRHLE